MWRWAIDRWWRPDKLWHFIGGLVSPLLLLAVFHLHWCCCLVIPLIFWWAWEVKDAFLSVEKAGWWGGDGFSWKDGLASTAGVVLGVLIVFFVKRG